jgi:hypothetical protein
MLVGDASPAVKVTGSGVYLRRAVGFSHAAASLVSEPVVPGD